MELPRFYTLCGFRSSVLELLARSCCWRHFQIVRGFFCIVSLLARRGGISAVRRETRFGWSCEHAVISVLIRYTPEGTS